MKYRAKIDTPWCSRGNIFPASDDGYTYNGALYSGEFRPIDYPDIFEPVEENKAFTEAALIKRIQTLEKALEFYASESCWKGLYALRPKVYTAIGGKNFEEIKYEQSHTDFGATARKALEVKNED